MDESGSMSGEQNWIKGAVTSLDTKLIAAGLAGNRFASVGFSVGNGPGLTRVFDVGGPGSPFGTAADFQALNYSISGGTEDGWAAITVANGLPFRAGNVGRNYILVTDEDRDNSLQGLSFASVLGSMTGTSTLLNAIVNAGFSCGGQRALGIDSKGNGYIANGSGGFTVCAGGTVGSGAGSTVADYVDLALGTGGAAWDLNLLRAGGVTADSFTAAFTAIKVQEIITQPPSGVPEPSTWVLTSCALIGLAFSRFRRRT
jgi:hypothetical protein